MRHSCRTAFPAAALVLAALAVGCATHVTVDPAGYGPPPAVDSAEPQVRAEVERKLKGRDPANITCGAFKKAYHAKLSMAGSQVLWQGYAAPVTMDVNTAAGHRVEGRHYAAMFSGDQLVGLVDYPGTTNPKGSLGFFWDDGKEPVAAAKQAEKTEQPTVALQAKPTLGKPAKADDLLIDPLRVDAESQAVAKTEPKSAPRTEPRQAPAVASGTPAVVVKPLPAPSTVAKTAPTATPAPVAPAAPKWAALPLVPAVGTKVYLASDKSYVGNVEEYADLHAFANGSVKPAVRVRYLNGAENWFPAKVAAQIYMVQAAK